MRPETRCPERQELHRLLLGEVSEDQADHLEAHLAGCADCLQTIRRLTADDALVAALRTGEATMEVVLADENKALTTRIRGLRSAASKTYAMAAYSFLTPGQGPGELGRFGPYRVLDLLGIGGMGIVFRAEDVALGRAVALKVLQPDLARDPSFRQRFYREARAMAAVRNDHVAVIHQVGEEGGVPFLAMELLTGESLEMRFQREGRLSVADLVRVGRDVARGLAAVHARGLIHRDVTPGNIWLERSGETTVADAPSADASSRSRFSADVSRVKLLDFGLARAANEERPLTREGVVAGTPGYMAPEQVQGQTLDSRCDLFSLGCVLYRAATGELPFRGHDALSRLHSLANDTVRPVRDLNPEVPGALADLIHGLLARHPADRLPSAQAVVEALQRLGPSGSRAGHRLRRLAVAAVPLVAIAVTALVMLNRFPRTTADTASEPAPTSKAAEPPLPLREGEVRVVFKGIVDNVDPKLSEVFRVGQSLSGAYTFRPDTPPRPGATEKSATFDPLTGLHFQLGDYSATSKGAQEIQIDNDLGDGNHDRYFILSRADDGLQGPAANGHALLTFTIRLDDSRDAAITTALKLPKNLNLAEFDSRGFGLLFDGPPAPVLVGGRITSLSTR